MRRVRGTAAALRMGAIVLAAIALSGGADRAEAATACGTLITNVATATMTSGFPDFVQYEVSYNATVAVMVLCPPVVRLAKWASTPLCAAGCTVMFQICIENQMTDSVWGLTITDILPTNMTFDSINNANFDTTVGGSFVLGPVVASNASSAAGPFSAGGPAAGQGATWYMRWVIPGIGPGRSACVTYKAKIL